MVVGIVAKIMPLEMRRFCHFRAIAPARSLSLPKCAEPFFVIPDSIGNLLTRYRIAKIMPK